MQHLKQLTMTLVALFAMTTGAWADEGTLLTTITPDGSGNPTYTIDGIATIDKDGAKYNSSVGWYSANSCYLTVTAAEGVNITKVKFTGNDGGTWEDTESPYQVHLSSWYVNNGSDEHIGTDAGVTKIEVYGYKNAAGTALTKDKNDATGRTWILDKMLAGNVELQVEYEPEFTATFVAKNGNTIESGKATVSVKEGEAAAVAAKLEGNALKGLYEGQTVILTAKQGYKFRDVSAKKAGAAGPTTAQLNVPTEWNGDNTAFSTNDLSGFVALTDEEAQAIACPDAEGNVYVIHDIPSDGYIKIIAFNNGEKQAQQSFTLGRDYNGLYDDAYNWDVKYYYTTGK